MNGELFDSTIPFGEPELLRASALRTQLTQLDATRADGSAASLLSGLSALSPSLQADLLRVHLEGGGSETIEVFAACLRHAKRVTIHLECGDKVVPLTLFPHERLCHLPADAAVALVERHIANLRVMLVEPAALRPPDDPTRSLVAEPQRYYPVGPVLWELAMRGARRELLPEIAGPAVYRVTPVLDLEALPVSGTLRSTIERLRRQTANLSEIASWPALDRERASRLLNALYLQSGLMISRSHPDALREGRFALL